MMHMLRVLAWLALLPILGGCVRPDPITFKIDGYNERLRGDRAALDAAQLAVDPAALRFGPWPTRADALVRALTPAHPEAASLVQSDCWFMARAPQGGGDAVRAEWEALATVTGDAPFEDPEDGRLDLGLCRLDDPQTRTPLLHRERRSDAFSEIDCGAELGTVVVPGTGNLFRCREDTAILAFRLTARRDTAPDPLGRCAAPGSARYAAPAPIAHGVDFWSGPHFEGRQGPEVGSCGAGNTLVPERATVYEIESPLGGPRQRFEPALLPVARGARVARPLAPTPAGHAWATPVDTHASGASRWRENWSPSLRVATVRLVGFDPPLAPDEVRPGAVPKPLDRAPAPRLCIEDPGFGPGCRWTCDDPLPADGGLAWPLLSQGTCRNAAGQVEAPLVTLTYAIDRLAAGAPSAPLRWSLAGSGWTQPWLEFELETTLSSAALRAEPPAGDAGRLQVGRSGRAAFRVDNVGVQPIEVTAVDVIPGSAQAADFRVELPFAPVPLPLPIEVEPGAGEAVVLPPPGAEEFPSLAIIRGAAHLRISERPDLALLRDGVSIHRRAGLNLRDVVDVRFSAKPRQPGAVQPVATTTWALRRVPFVVQPGEAFDLSVLARPSAIGTRQVPVRVRGRSTIDPTRTVEIVVVASARGLAGPRLVMAPAQLYVSAPSPGVERTRSVLLINDGDVAGAPGAPVLTAVGPVPAQGLAFRLDLPEGGAGALAPGVSRLARITFRSRCLPGATGLAEERAELRWPTPDGTLAVPLRGATWCGP